MKTGLILGFFDGVHAGHQAVIKSALEYAERTVLITFNDSPAKFFNQKYEYILSRPDSINKIKTLGVDDVVLLDFDSIANMSAEEYLEYLVSEYSPASISTGFNHTFGKNKGGDCNFLEENQQKYGYKYLCTPPLMQNGEIVSSTLIRKLLHRGELEQANSLLKSNFTLEGTVIKGAQLGRTIGFPTANINYPENIVKLPYGVYFAMVGKNNAVLNWGIKPTVHNTLEPVLEAHILGLSEDLYGKEIRIEFLKRIREERKFSSLDELKNQIEKDIISCSK